jgi:hypothetical protein
MKFGWMKQVGIGQLQLEEGFKETKDRIFIVELKDRALNRILLLYMKIESKSDTFGIRGSSEEERGSFYFSPMVGWLSLDQDLLGP